MDKQELEALGFTKKRDIKDPKPVERRPQTKTKVVEKVVEKPVEKKIVVPVIDQTPMMEEVAQSNKVMHDAIKKLTESLKSMDNKPKKLVCQNIVRDGRTGLMESFEIKVVE